ncbi:alpha/beta hydrolase [Paenibacillus sp. J2TS4]|uniref:alpha/beta hydrolase n=1 Tax=Paenibacillus sp. J2TS4 TaxID=2807194 RepID=UPI001B100AD4|nr:alpha/beta hydrolase [Paenibacillus sp. J2TS4]GIP32002.1 ferri-bacillibactin esterase BesA [Paenibacillus sp. J2TS4]
MAYQEKKRNESPSQDITGEEVTIPRTEQWDMGSSVGHREYRIFVAKPHEAPPPAGYPVIYVLDANSIFGTMVEAMRLQSRRPEKTGVVPAVIVGVGYPTEAPFDPARFYDFTLPTPMEELPLNPKGEAWPELGGAQSFLDFIENDLKPIIERKLDIDRSRQTIFGHSLGGLFVLQVLFANSDAFQTYVAGSPSIHWNRSFLLEAERQFAARAERERLAVHVLIGVGELEKSHRMIDNAKELGDRLSGLAGFGVRSEFKEFEGEGHISVLPVLASRAVRFASARVADCEDQ